MNTVPPPLVHRVSDREAKAQVKKLFAQVEKNGSPVPQWMRVMANCGDILMGFSTMFKAIMDDAPVNKLLKWKVAYRVSEMNRCQFCVDISKIKLKEFGISEQEIVQLNKSSGKNEKAAIKFAEEATAHAYAVNPQTFAELQKYFTDEQIVEITSVVGLFNFINRFNEALRILPGGT